jgi:8-oxo-dGTP diphosphatase
MQKGIDYIGVGSGAMIFNGDGLVFMAERGPKARNEVGKWDFPGGSVEFGENCEDAVAREIKEEFDFDIEVIELLDVVNHILADEKQHWVSPSFIAKHKDGSPKIMEPEKCTGFKWLKLEEIDSSLLTATSKISLQKYVQKFGFNKPNFESKNGVLAEDVFLRELEMCKKLSKEKGNKCCWGSCDKCGVIPLLYKLHKGVLLDDPDEIEKVKAKVIKRTPKI